MTPRFPGRKPTLAQEEVFEDFIAKFELAVGHGLGDFIEILTGIEDGDEDDLGSWVNNLLAVLRGDSTSGSTAALFAPIVLFLSGKWLAIDDADARAAQAGSIAEAVGGLAVTTDVIDGYTVVRYSYTTNGTWSGSPTPPTGYEWSHAEVQVINGGDGGDRPDEISEGGHGGTDGGVWRKRVPLDDLTTTHTVTVGAGGSGRTSSSGFGQTGGASSFGSLVTAVSGVGVLETEAGRLHSADKPGRGGDGGSCVLSNVNTVSGVKTYSNNWGRDGEASTAGAGGTGGRPASGWWGSATAATAGTAGTASGTKVSGGSGGGGGTTGGAGAAGAAPGGGGGGGGSGQFVGTNGGNGGNGRVDVFLFAKEIA